jgi:hypothetical protein
MTVTRRTFIAYRNRFCWSVAQAEEFVFKYANNQPMTHPMMFGRKKWRSIRRDTGRRWSSIAVNWAGTDVSVSSEAVPSTFSLSSSSCRRSFPRLRCRRQFRLPDYDAVWKAWTAIWKLHRARVPSLKHRGYGQDLGQRYRRR